MTMDNLDLSIASNWGPSSQRMVPITNKELMEWVEKDYDSMWELLIDEGFAAMLGEKPTLPTAKEYNEYFLGGFWDQMIGYANRRGETDYTSRFWGERPSLYIRGEKIH